jgi:hypothetical protein
MTLDEIVAYGLQDPETESARPPAEARAGR